MGAPAAADGTSPPVPEFGMSFPNAGSGSDSSPTSVADAGREATPPPEMNEALALVLRIGGRDLLQKVVALFRTTSEQRLGAMRAAHGAGDAYQVSRLSHAMKGSAAQVGAEGLRAASFALEKEAQSLAPEQVAARIEAIAQEAVVAWAQLQTYARTAGGES